VSSGDLGTFYRTEPEGLKIVEEFASLTASRSPTPSGKKPSLKERVDIRESRITPNTTAAAPVTPVPLARRPLIRSNSVFLLTEMGIYVNHVCEVTFAFL
jgi:hypothetical protein